MTTIAATTPHFQTPFVAHQAFIPLALSTPIPNVFPTSHPIPKPPLLVFPWEYEEGEEGMLGKSDGQAFSCSAFSSDRRRRRGLALNVLPFPLPLPNLLKLTDRPSDSLLWATRLDRLASHSPPPWALATVGMGLPPKP